MPAEPSPAHAASRGSAIKLVADTVGRLLSLATTVLILKSLGPDGFGIFTPLAAVAVIVADLSDLGLQLAATRALVARTLGLGDLVRARSILTTGVLLVCAGAWLFSPALGLLTLFFVLSNWCEFSGVALRVRGRRIQEALLLACLRAACLVAVAVAGQDLLRICWAQTLSTLLPLALAAWLVRRAYRPEARPAPTAPVSVLRSAVPLGLNNLLALASLRLELMLLPAFRSDLETGLFAAALRVIEFLVSIPAAVAAGAMPFLTREALGGGNAVRRRTAYTTVLLAVPAAAGLGLVASDLALFVDPRYLGAAGPLRILALAVVPLFLNGILSYALVAAGSGQILPRLTAWRLTSAGLCALALIPAFGPVGAAAGFVASETILLALMQRSCRRAGFGLPLGAPLGLAVALTIPMALVVGLAPLAFVARCGLGVGVYGLTIALACSASRRLRQTILH